MQKKTTVKASNKRQSQKNNVSSKGLAAVYTGPGEPLDIRTYPVLPPQNKNALLRLERSGICGTDVHIFEGRLPVPGSLIPGHEFIGRIIETGRAVKKDGMGRTIKPGDRAIACVAQPCGRCFNCRRGETASCLQFGVTYVRNPEELPHFFGGYAEYLHHPANCLVSIPDSINIDAVSAFPCAGPTAIRAYDYAGGLEKGEIVVVQGAGPVGLFSIAYAAKAGCVVVAIGSGRDPRRVSLAKKMGAKLFFDYKTTKPEERLEAVRKLANRNQRGDGADVVFEASGSPQAINEGLSLVRTRGRYLVPGQYSNSGGISINPQTITFKAIRMIGSGQYTLNDIGTYIRFLAKNADLQKTFARCITHRYSIGEAETAWRNAANGLSIKGVFEL